MTNDLKAYVIDDEEEAREALRFQLSTAGIPAESFASAVEFLERAREARGVLITDLKTPDMDGIELVKRLAALGISLPVILVTGYGDVSRAVEAMKAGAVDFIEKPFKEEALLDAIRAAFARAVETRARDQARSDCLARLDRLSARERQVLERLVFGRPNKTIASELGLSSRTVEIYRAHVMTKMAAGSLSELVRMSLLVGA